MKITFTFSDSANLASLTSDDLCQSHFEFPDTVLQLPDIRDRILTLANLVGQMTKAILHITCKELGLKNYPIKIEKTTNHWIHIEATHPTVLRFQGWDHRRRKSKTIKIIAPEKSGIPEHLTRYAGYTGGFTTLQLAEGKRYPEALKIYQISDLCFSLLSEDKLWQWYPFVQVHPYRFDAAASKRMSKISRKHRREKERLEKQQCRKSYCGRQDTCFYPGDRSRASDWSRAGYIQRGTVPITIRNTVRYSLGSKANSLDL